MKKLIMLFALTVFFISCNTPSKIGYVDMDKVLKEYDGFKKAEEQMKTRSTKLATDFQQANMQFQKKVQDYQQKRSKMSSKEASDLEQHLMQEQQMIQQQQQMIQQQFQQEGSQFIEKINEEIKTYIDEFAGKKGYDFILGTSNQTQSVLYGNEKSDLTQQIIDGLNKDLPSGTEEPTEKAKDSVAK